MALKHPLRGRALIVMVQTQHPHHSCTPLYARTRIYCLLDKNVSFPPSHLFAPSLFHTLFFPLPPLSSLLTSSPVPLITTSVMIHVVNHRQIFEGFSPHRSLFPSSSLLYLFLFSTVFLSSSPHFPSSFSFLV